MALEIFGKLNLLTLLEETNGSVEYTLIDAGMIRPFSANYEYGKLNESTIWIKPKNTKTVIEVPTIIDLSPSLLISFGMYDGDGNKTGQIGFAQNNTKLQEFVSIGIEKVFPNIFPSQVSILEDSKFFESEEMKTMLEASRPTIKKEIGKEPSVRELQNNFLINEFKQMKFNIGNLVDKISVTVSSKKGAQSIGQRSYEIIINKKGSRDFRILYIYIIKSLIDEILGINPHRAFSWECNPQNQSMQNLNIVDYIKSGRCKYMSKAGKTLNYEISEVKNDTIVIKKSSGGSKIHVRKLINISPLLCLMIGIYWAEGTTTKDKLFKFRNEYQDGLGIGFNSSEDNSLQLFLNTLTLIYPDLNEIISCWLVKIGAKYHAESSALASKLGVPVFRGGPGGDGIARTPEITNVVKKWALDQFPVMNEWIKFFSHLEFTGAGIPRVDIRGKSPSAQFLFSIMSDLTFYEDDISAYLENNNHERT